MKPPRVVLMFLMVYDSFIFQHASNIIMDDRKHTVILMLFIRRFPRSTTFLFRHFNLINLVT